METVSVVLFLLSAGEISSTASTPPVQSQLTSLHIIPGDMNQTEARNACREKYTDLVTVYSDEDNIKLYNLRITAWIGLYRSNFSEKWSNGDNVTYRNLTGDCGTSSVCAVMKADGSWESLLCTDTRYFMCYEQASSQTRNYHLILETKTWYEAQHYCRQRYTDLVSIRDQQHNEEVKIKGLNSRTPFWIGLLCDDWQWIDGGISAYRNWYQQIGAPYPSPNNCVVLSGGRWYSVLCDYRYFAFCYSTSTPPVQSQLTSLHIIPGDMNQTEARKACRENYIDLVTMYSDQDNTKLAELMMKAGIYDAWIGLYRSNFSEKWSNGDPVTFRNLTGDCGISSYCATMKPGGSWESLQCTATRYFMCYDPDASSQTHNYHLILKNKTWYEAQHYCRQRYTDLVSIRDQQHNEEVMIKGLNSTASFWIGLLCDDWQWIDGGISAYRNWGWQSSEPHPSQYNCVVHYIWGWGWYSVPCNYPYSAFCYYNYIHVSEEALSWEKALDYCDKGNKAGILIIDSQAEQEQLESELMRRGVPPGSLWVGLGPNRLSELKVSSEPLTCEDIQRQSEADTHTADAAPDYVMDSTELRVVCKLK
ncbi:secretory phospholipase A2 receptor-like isoform X2 [Tachysurus vachellii]|uniref:secretory phospholipase A2 receptor-like isoform X2 n=1 Tax=Tachysurus vachellii TaxID=175792 RepID=UPI00296AC0B4|nr:secretory phospholipase A2 receptor-like isoform X2 [Tachysurus vachellii]